jgi:hypothetical protein
MNVVRNGDNKKLALILPDNRVSNVLIDTNKQKIKKYLQQIISIFNAKDSLEINIADSYLSLEDEEGNQLNWGSATHCSDNSYLLLIDTSAWNTQTLIHEMIHPFNKYEPVREDSAYYFFHESIIEYLAVCLGYANEHQRDSVFDAKIQYYNDIDSNALYTSSIFKVMNNNTVMDGSKGGSSPLIYRKAPYKIHKLAQSLGEENFIFLLSKFYKNVQEKKECNFLDFEKILKDNGLTDVQWLEFMKDL